MQKKNSFPERLSSVFFCSRKVAFISLLFGIALLALLYSSYRQVKETAYIELPTGQAERKTSKVSTALVTASREVLVLNSYHVGHTWSDNEMAGIIEVLQEASPDIRYHVEYLDCKHYPKYEHFELVKDLFKLKYGNREIPVVIVTDNPALEFALKYRALLFPRSSIVFCGINNFKKEMLEGQKNITGLAEVLDAVDTMRVALTLHPKTKEVFIVHDYTSTGLATRREAEKQMKGMFDRVSFRYVEDMTKKEMTQLLRGLSEDSLVFVLGYSVFKDGEIIGTEDVARLFSANSPVPVYGVHQERLGYGIVGGSLLSGKLHGAHAGRVALKILSGTQASNIPVDMNPPTRMMFDYNQLVRFWIPSKALPEGGVIVNRPVSFISSHKYLVASIMLVIIILTSGIIILGLNVHQRGLAEEALRRSKEELELRVLERTAELQNVNEQLQHELAERKRSESVLRQIEAELNESQRVAHIGSWDWDATTDTIWWSDEYYRIYNIDPKLPTPNYIEHLKVYTSESAGRLDAAVKMAMETGEPYELDLELANPTVTTRWIVARGEAKRDAGGTIWGLRGTAQNITERKKAEVALQRNQDMLARTEGIAHVGSWEWEVATDTVTWSDELFHIFQLDPADGAPSFAEHPRLYHPDDMEKLKLAVEAAVKEGVPYEMELRAIRTDGETRVCRAQGYAEMGPGGKATRLFGSFQDITERKRAETEKEQFYRFFQTSADMMAIADPNGSFMKTNPACTETLGYSGTELVAKPFIEFIHPEDKQSTIDEMARQLQRGYSLNFENRYICKDGSIKWLSWRAIYSKEEGITYATARDITDRKRDEEEIRKLNEVLEQRIIERTAELYDSQRALVNIVEDLNLKTEELKKANIRLKEMDRMKSMFIASMSHELRTPLNSIIGFSSILLNEWTGPVNAEQKGNLSTILKSGRHLLNLINDIIDVSKIEAGKIDSLMENFDLHDVIEEAVNSFSKEIYEKRLSLTVEAVHQEMHTDRRRLLQCVLNLLSNAVKFTERGSLSVLACIGIGDWGLGVGEKEDRNLVEISVKDTGIGISEEDYPKLFNAFVRLDSSLRASIPGTGLGLYLTKKLVAEVLKGDILFSSRHGEGSTFSIIIPVRIDEKGPGNRR
ncbi:MAG: PAS domain-containing protein [Nitrospirae bacterium]|nr:PAS domain-containing protein [Nitrospirota bacterium]